MAEQNVDNTVTTPAQEDVKPTPTEAAKTGGKTYTDAEVEQIVKDRLERERSKRDQAAREAAEKAKAEEAAKAGDFEKLLKLREQELEDARRALKAKEREELKRTIAERVGLPAGLAARLTGESAEEMEADAKALLDALPKQTKPQPGIVTNPGNPQQGKTTAQRLAEIHGGQGDPFDIAIAKQKGGGVFWPDPKE